MPKFTMDNNLGSRTPDRINEQDFLVLKSNGYQSGNSDLRTVKCPIASLFKIVIAFGALESGELAINEELDCNDTLPITGKCRLNIREALFYSSNDFFKQLTTRLTLKVLIDAMQYLHLPSSLINEEHFPNEWSDLWMGAGIQVTPLEVFCLTERLAHMAETNEHQSFIGALESLDEKREARVFRKTGTWGGAAWCTGFSMDRRNGAVQEIATILIRYTVPNWQPAHCRAIEEFQRELPT